MTSADQVPIPKRMAKLPRHGALPIPYIVLINSETGIPMFSFNNEAKKLEVINDRKCGQCGEKLFGQIAFVGGDEEVDNNRFVEPGMHLDCARYAMRVCPYLSTPNYQPRRPEAKDPRALQSPFDPGPPDRPVRMGILIARDYKAAFFGPQYQIEPIQILRVEWLENDPLQRA